MNKFIIIHTYAGYVNKNSTQTKKEINVMLLVNLEVLRIINVI